jgi:hypothetical protein
MSENMNRRAIENPHLPRLLYIQGILQNRCAKPYENFVERLGGLIVNGWSTDDLERIAKTSRSWSDLVDDLHKFVEARRG